MIGEESVLPAIPDEIEGIDAPGSDGWGEYPLDTVFVRTEQRTVGEVVKRIQLGRYQLDPDFQRDFVWTPVKQSRLIESSLMRIPLPVFYVAEDKDGRIIVVDGLQRLTTFYKYMNDNFALKGLESADSEKQISNKKFSELPVHLQERIEDTQLTLYILDSKAPERARLDIFERVNSGEPLTRQQMRNCLYSGSATRWLKSASENILFLKATGGALKAKTMRDREVINRFCAFYLLGHDAYRGDMESFLADTLERMNASTEAELEELRIRFENSMRLNIKIFGEHAFRKSAANTLENPARTVLNVSMFDVFAVLFAKYYDEVESKKDKVIAAVTPLFINPAFIHSITYSTSSSKPVRARFGYVLEALRGGGIC